MGTCRRLAPVSMDFKSPDFSIDIFLNLLYISPFALSHILLNLTHNLKIQQKKMATSEKDKKKAAPSHFIRNIIVEDIKNNKHDGKVATRFPPEPNGFLHIGHSKAICLSFGMAQEFKGTCNLRFDDTNPGKESIEYVKAIKQDIKWLGFDWEDREYYASDYFEQLFQYAVQLIQKGKAYICSLNEAEIREYRGNYYIKGRPSPYRDRTVEENLDLFNRMRAGEFEDGAHVLRAKIDMDSQNMHMRDPVVYRIRKLDHHRTKDAWCIYPMYDFTHCTSDSIEGITHSLCSLEFEEHRPLYDWFLDELETECHPQQIEFARLNINYTILSKRKLLELVELGAVSGWDDPRMPSLSGLRRRGYTPESIRNFSDKIGMAKANSLVDISLLEHCIREDLNKTSKRVMAVLKPLKITITNFPEDKTVELDAPYFHEDFSHGSRMVPLTREIYVEQDDFKEVAPKKWFRLAPGKEVRLRYACLITCQEIIKDEETGEVIELHCTWDPESVGGKAPDGRRVRGTLHWVSAREAIKAEVRLYDRLFNKPNPTEGDEDFKTHLHPDSLEILESYLEPSLAGTPPGARYQFERLGYFCTDIKDSKEGALVFNRTVTLRDSWAKIEKAQAQKQSGGSKKPRRRRRNKKQG